MKPRTYIGDFGGEKTREEGLLGLGENVRSLRGFDLYVLSMPLREPATRGPYPRSSTSIFS